MVNQNFSISLFILIESENMKIKFQFISEVKWKFQQQWLQEKLSIEIHIKHLHRGGTPSGK